MLDTAQSIVLAAEGKRQVNFCRPHKRLSRVRRFHLSNEAQLHTIHVKKIIESCPSILNHVVECSYTLKTLFMMPQPRLIIILYLRVKFNSSSIIWVIRECSCRGPRVVVSTAAFQARVRGSVPGLGGLKETKLFLPHPRVKVSIVGSLRDREVACSASDRQGSNFESCVWRTVSSQSSHHPQEVLLAQFSLYVHKGGLKPDSFHFMMPQPRLIIILHLRVKFNSPSIIWVIRECSCRVI